MKKLLALLVIFSGFATTIFAQNQNEVEMADQLRSSGKIYVVVTVLVAIFVGIIAYLVAIDRKLSRLEREINKKD
ncbi:MAG: CcmD family protein [Bacteroidetes bacterium]|nr:CcmD family protein [Bacteroidota bacterium]